MAGQLSALAGLGALGDLDLDVIGIDEVLAGDAEAARGDLFDGAAAQVPVRIGLEARWIFAALAGVGFGAHTVHGDRERLVRFLADRAIGHRAGREALEDRFRRLHVFQRDWIFRQLEFEQATQRRQVLVLFVY